MDPYKLEKLRSIDYEISPQCGYCAHSTFAKDEDAVGICNLTTYRHPKQTPTKRQLTIRRDGVCILFRADEKNIDKLEQWAEFWTEK